MKIYLGGPMRGYPLWNFPAFDDATRALRARGHHVWSPAEHDRETGFDGTCANLDDFDLAGALRWDISRILDADAVVFLPGHENSEGCAIERTVADAIGCPVHEYLDLR